MEPYVTKWVAARTETSEEKEHLGGLIKTGGGENTGEISFMELADSIALACNDLAQDRYEVISILPVDRGIGVSGAYGHSITAGVIITAKKVG